MIVHSSHSPNLRKHNSLLQVALDEHFLLVNDQAQDIELDPTSKIWSIYHKLTKKAAPTRKLLSLAKMRIELSKTMESAKRCED